MTPRRVAAAALLADAACLIVFAATGRRSHDETLGVAGVVTTAWPFLVGAALGWLLSRGHRAPTAVWPTGIAVWLGAVVVGMLLRRVSAQGTASAFVVVATLVTAALLLGWRAALPLVRGVANRQRRA